MANSQGKPHSGPAQGDVSSCVSNLVQAFANSLDVFKRLRERRQKRKNKKQQSSNQPEVASGDELQLSNALRRNPQDIQNCYQQHYGKAGERFAKGDGTYPGATFRERYVLKSYVLTVAITSRCALVPRRNTLEAQRRAR